MFKKILLIFILLFLSFSTSFADWKTDIDKGNYKLFSEIYPDKQDIYEFQSIKLNDKGEFVIEYTKNHYEKLLKVYGGRNILIFDLKNKQKNKFNTKTEFKGNSVFITILKDEKLDLAYEHFSNCNKLWNDCYFNSFDGTYSDILIFGPNNNHEINKTILKLLKKGSFENINKYISKTELKYGIGYHNGNINFNLPSSHYGNHLTIEQKFILKKGLVNFRNKNS